MKGIFESFYFTKTFEGFDGVSVSDVVWFEAVSDIRDDVRKLIDSQFERSHGYIYWNKI